MDFFALKRRLSPLTWDWIQVEVTTRCNAICSYCPRSIAGESWPEQDLAISLFQRLLPDLPRVRHVHLQGWGEPFLHPELFQMARLSRRAGCQVGTTTNGTLMDEGLAREILEAGFTVVAFSLAGTGPWNDRIRKGAPLERVLEGMRVLARARARAGSRIPEIHVAYMLLGSAAEELQGLPGLLEGIPVSQVVVSTLDCVLDRSLEKELVFLGEETLLSRLSEVRRKLAARGTALHHSLGDGREACFPCTENVLRAAVVGAQGDVGPCVYTNLSLPRFKQWREGKQEPLWRLCFGNLAQYSLREIWEHPAYVEFRRSFSKGAPGPACASCPKRCGV